MPKKYAFFMHPLSLGDINVFEPNSKGKNEALVRKMLEWMPPFPISQLSGKSKTGEEFRGVRICIPLLPEQITPDPKKLGNREANRLAAIANEKLLDAVDIAGEFGATIIGLGAHTSIAGRQGKLVEAKANTLGIPVTSGNSYTAIIAVKAAIRASRRMGIVLKSSKVVVIGATGSVGGVITEILAPLVDEIVLVGTNEKRLAIEAAGLEGKRKKRYPKNISYTTDIREALLNAKLVLSCTSSEKPVINDSSLFRPGSVICDIARPRDVAREVSGAKGILVIEGGIIRLPRKTKVSNDEFPTYTNMDLPDNFTFACEAETIVRALSPDFLVNSLRATAESAYKVSTFADIHGLELGKLRNYGEKVSTADVVMTKIRSIGRASETLEHILGHRRTAG